MVDFILTTFVVCGAVLSVITLHSCWIAAKTKTVLSWIYPIVVLLAIAFATKGVIDIQGYPINGKPTGDWEYLTHTMDGPAAVVTTKQKEIRVYRFVPTEQEKDKMGQAEKAKDQGKRPRLNTDLPNPTMELIRLDEENPK